MSAHASSTITGLASQDQSSELSEAPRVPATICGGHPGGFVAYDQGGCRAGAAAGSAAEMEEMMLVMVGVLVRGVALVCWWHGWRC